MTLPTDWFVALYGRISEEMIWMRLIAVHPSERC
jgi:hypothetical protein